ncbi:HAMP domain-containing protein [Phototrophicus methaneseepsis]|uniref:histidine kinase n=1 Tax=Phototrophicus methaneseepsis TaxID=2710758 RepID=A0A7S8ICP4_9CHLR|nr:histidine kinase [Phototrophicus methaneseepsis]QPC80519.1 HAMP domain-containing protein [Phototrophicus methaneseepsis]
MNNILESRLFQRFWQFAGAVSIRVKVLGIVLSVILLLSIFVTMQMRSALFDTIQHNLEHQGHALASQFAETLAPLIQADDIEGITAYLLDRQHHYSTAGHNTAVEYISVIGEGQQINTWGEAPPPSTTIENVIHLEAPIEGTDAMLHLGIADVTVDQTVQEVTIQLLMITLVMVAFGFAAAFFLTWILTRPIYDLVDATQAVARGDFSQRVSRWADDEIGELSIAFNSMTKSLAQAEVEREEREQMRSQYVNNVITAQEDERKRIARELHDSTGQSLTSLLVGLKNLKDADGDETVSERIDDLRDIVSRTLDEVRQMAWQLRPSALDDLGLISALHRYIDDYQQRFNVQVDFVTKDMDGRLQMEIETSIYRVVQEALTNIARHAQATTASVIIDRRPNAIRIIVEDNGVGFVPPSRQESKSLGLQGIRERAALFNGTLTIETEPGHGTSLFIEIPLDQKSIAETNRNGTE